MAWCRQAPSHYLSQYWPRSMLPYGFTRPQSVNPVGYDNINWYINKGGFRGGAHQACAPPKIFQIRIFLIQYCTRGLKIVIKIVFQVYRNWNMYTMTIVYLKYINNPPLPPPPPHTHTHTHTPTPPTPAFQIFPIHLRHPYLQIMDPPLINTAECNPAEVGWAIIQKDLLNHRLQCMM